MPFSRRCAYCGKFILYPLGVVTVSEPDRAPLRYHHDCYGRGQGIPGRRAVEVDEFDRWHFREDG